jgi:hypothetical protein
VHIIILMDIRTARIVELGFSTHLFFGITKLWCTIVTLDSHLFFS